MKSVRSFLLPLLAFGALAWLPIQAWADDRLAGYWVPAADEGTTAAFSFSILGKWTIVSARWDGSTPDFKIRYTVAPTGAGGALTADEKPDHLQGAPRVMTYEVSGSELFLTIPDTAHSGKYHLVKGTPPASAPAAAPIAPPRPANPAPPRAMPAHPQDPNAVLGHWSTEPGSSVQVDLRIVIATPTSVKITQLWIKGSDKPVTSRAAEYTAGFAPGGRGSFTRAKVDADDAQVPVRLEYAFAGDALILTVDDGGFIGQYRLIRMAR